MVDVRNPRAKVDDLTSQLLHVQDDAEAVESLNFGNVLDKVRNKGADALDFPLKNAGSIFGQGTATHEEGRQALPQGADIKSKSFANNVWAPEIDSAKLIDEGTWNDISNGPGTSKDVNDEMIELFMADNSIVRQLTTVQEWWALLAQTADELRENSSVTDPRAVQFCA